MSRYGVRPSSAAAPRIQPGRFSWPQLVRGCGEAGADAVKMRAEFCDLEQHQAKSIAYCAKFSSGLGAELADIRNDQIKCSDLSIDFAGDFFNLLKLSLIDGLIGVSELGKFTKPFCCQTPEFYFRRNSMKAIGQVCDRQ